MSATVLDAPIQPIFTPFAGSLPTPSNCNPTQLPTLPCLRRWTPDDVRKRLHEPIDAMRKRRGLPPLTEEQRKRVYGEYVLRTATATNRGGGGVCDGFTPPAGQGRGGPGEVGGPQGALDPITADPITGNPIPQNPIAICGSLSFWLDSYGRWHCCECDPWKGKLKFEGKRWRHGDDVQRPAMVRGYHVVDRVPVGMDGAKVFLVGVEEYGGNEMIVDRVDLGWVLGD